MSLNLKAYRVTLVTAEDVANGVVKDSVVYLHSQVPNALDLFYFIDSPESEEGVPLRMSQVQRVEGFDVVEAADPGATPVEDLPVQAFLPIDLDPPVKNSRGAGLKYDQGKPRPTLLHRGCAYALTGIASILAYGAQKYAADSWRQVENGTERYTDALLRHLYAWLGGEARDEESGLPHLWHAATNLLFIIELTKEDYE